MDALMLTLFCLFREHAKLLTKGDNNAADDTELCMSYPHLFHRETYILTCVYRCKRSGLLGATGYHWQCWYVFHLRHECNQA